MMTYFLVGSPLSGKTTIANELLKKFKYKYFSTGDFARENGMKDDREIGDSDIDLTLDDKIRQKVINIATKTEETYIIDGFPRSVDQVMDIFDSNIKFKIIFMYVNPIIMYDRIKLRGRSDDDISKVSQRAKASQRLFKHLKSIVNENEILFFENGVDDMSILEEFMK